MDARAAIIFGQFGGIADPVNLPAFRVRLAGANIGTILVQHTDTQKVYDFLKGFGGVRIIVGSSLGAMASVVNAGYLAPTPIHFVGGFQPSDWDPSGHTVNIPLHHDGNPMPYDVVTRAIEVPANVRQAICFRNPVVGATGGLGHATYLAADPSKTKLEVIERLDVHPGDFPPAADTMFNRIIELCQ